MMQKTVKPLRCSEAAKYICENLDEQLNSQKCRAIRKHLQTCPKCVRQLDSLKKTVLLYRNCPAPRLSKKDHEKLMAVLSLNMKKK